VPSLPSNEVYGISGPLACGSDLLFPTEEIPEKVQEQIHRVKFHSAFFLGMVAPVEQRMHRVWHRTKEQRERLDPPRPSVEDVIQKKMKPLRLRSVRLPINAALLLLAAIALDSSAQDTPAPAPKSQAQAPDVRTRLTIEVTGGDNNVPVENASVYLKYIEERKLLKDKKLELSVKTNREGIAHVSDARLGKALIQIVADGWKTYGRWFDISDPKQIIKVHLERPPKWY